MSKITTENAELDQTYYTLGCDMGCRVCITKIVLVKILTAAEIAEYSQEYDCVTKSGGIRVLGHLSSLYSTRAALARQIADDRLSGGIDGNGRRVRVRGS